MKFLFSLFALVMLTESCSSTKEAVSNSNETTMETPSKRALPTNKNDIVGNNYDSSVTYKALARGSYMYIQISKSSVSISTDRNLKEIDTYTCDEKDWEAIERLVKVVDRETFRKLKAPTDKRLYDGAAHATLSITNGDMIIMTPTFDHGFPPEEIKALVNKVLSIKENIVKQ